MTESDDPFVRRWPSLDADPGDSDDSAGFAGLVGEVRTFLATLAAARSSELRHAENARTVAALRSALPTGPAPESDRLWGRSRAPGHGNVYVPPYVVERADLSSVAGTVMLDESHNGRQAAHGGVLPMMIDDILGHLAEMDGARVRTARLGVNYLRLTPIGRLLTFDATVDRVDGRKRWLSARVACDDTRLVEADALFIRIEDH